MIIEKKYLIVLLLIVYLLPISILGNVRGDTINKLFNNVSGFYSGYGLNYKETNQYGTFLDSENGVLNGLTIELNKSFGNIVTTVGGDIYFGDLTYKGYSWDWEPVTFHAHHTVYDGYSQLAYLWQPTDNFVIITPIIKGSYHHWNRPVCNETYQHWVVAAGAGLGYLINDKVYLSGDFLLGSTFGASMTSGQDFLHDQIFHLGNKPYYEENIRVSYLFSPKFFLSLFISSSQYKYSASMINGSGEPSSRSYSTSAGFGFSYAF